MLSTIIPRRPTERFAFAFLMCGTLGCYIFDLRVVIPHIYQDATFPMFIHALCGTFIVANIFGNLYYMITTDTSTKNKIMPASLDPGWRFCVTCEACAPPRSLHCYVCQKCILRRDHHCLFGGCCIGMQNSRYFFMLLVYIVVGGLYATVLNMFYIWTLLGGFTFKTFIMHLFSMVSFLLGYLEFRVAIQCFLTVIGESGFLYGLILLIFHFSLLFQNQTIFEKNRAIYTYDLGWKQNVKETLGDRWFLVWIFPAVPSRLPGDGIRFKTKENFYLLAEKTR